MNVNYDYESEINSCKRNIVQLINFPDPKHFEGDRLNIQRDALVGLIKDNEDSAASLLHGFVDAAPITFRLRWPTTLSALQAFGTNPSNALGRLGQLFGWAYIESVWIAQVTGRQAVEIGGPHFSVLAAIQLGLSEKLTEREVIVAIATHSTLMSSLLMERFEQSVKGGLEKINSMDARIAGWEERLHASEGRADKTEEKINAYQETINKFKVTFGIEALSVAFKDFFRRKRTERNFWALLSVILAAFILTVPSIELTLLTRSETPNHVAERELGKSDGHLTSQEPSKSNHAQEEIHKSASTADAAEVANDKWSSLLSKYLPIVGLEILLIYFFRISLMQFNTTKGQLLQLEMRIAVCQFIEEYVKFSKDNDKPDLSKFEAMIFSPVVSDADKIPSTFDGIEQLEKLISAARGK